MHRLSGAGVQTQRIHPVLAGYHVELGLRCRPARRIVQGSVAAPTCRQACEECDVSTSQLELDARTASTSATAAHVHPKFLTTGASHVARHPLVRLASVSVAVAAAVGISLLAPASGHCAEVISGDAFSAFKSFLEYVETSGPTGTAVFLLVVMLLEMVPLFPTQPFSIASGLMFGPIKGTLLVIAGSSLAAVGAFTISRGVGRRLAEKVIVMEAGDRGPVQAKLAEVQHSIRSGGLWQQLTAVTLLRLTPVVPFSAANYVLGLTPVRVPAYLGGTLIGSAVYSTLYASIGAASRELLDNGMDIGDLLGDLAEQGSKYSSVGLTASVGIAAVAGAAYAISILKRQQQQQLQGEQSEPPVDPWLAKRQHHQSSHHQHHYQQPQQQQQQGGQQQQQGQQQQEGQAGSGSSTASRLSSSSSARETCVEEAARRKVEAGGAHGEGEALKEL